MSRRKKAPKRQILPDPLFRSQLLAKFINVLMQGGKKSISESITYNALELMLTDSKLLQFMRDQDDSGGESGGGSSLSFTGTIRDSETARKVALALFEKALEVIKPVVEVKSRRVGGSTYQVPIEVRASRRTALGMRWIVLYARERSEQTMIIRLAREFSDALQGRGGAFKKKADVHRMAQANQAFAHYRW